LRGDGLRTGVSASAVVRVGKRGRARIESDTTIRFLAPSDAESGSVKQSATMALDVERGQAVIDVGDADLALQTRAGSAVLRRGARVVLQKAGDGASATTRYRVLVGGATFLQAGGGKMELAAGQSVSIGIGLAVLDPIDAPPTKTAITATQQAEANSAPGEAAAHAGDAAVALPTEQASPEEATEQPVEQRLLVAAALKSPESGAAKQTVATPRLDREDLSVPVGESFRVYDVDAPTVIEFRFGARCPSGGELTVEGQAPVRGEHAVRMDVAAGTHGYALRCTEPGDARTQKPAARGSVRVLRGSGVRTLAKTAPRNSVDLDGRRYTLMYQNLRPLISVGWVGAPSAKGYVLSLRAPDGKSKSFRTREARFVLQSGEIDDGTHAVSMQTEGKPTQRSKETLIDIVFDNAAPTESLELPRPEGFANGTSTRIAGVALEGSRLTVGAQSIPLDAAHRFSQNVPLAADQKVLVLRFQHPRSGIRYYLRQALGAPR
jgi:hypothetical protein